MPKPFENSHSDTFAVIHLQCTRNSYFKKIIKNCINNKKNYAMTTRTVVLYRVPDPKGGGVLPKGGGVSSRKAKS